MLQGISALWECLEIWETIPKLSDSAGPLQRDILEQLCKALENHVNLERNSLKVGAVAALTLRCAVATLRRQVERIGQYTEPTLASIILTMLGIYNDIPSVKGILKGQLYPLALALMRDEHSLNLLQTDLQVVRI